MEGTSARPSPGYTPRVSCLAHPPPTPGQALGHVVGGGDRLQKRPSCLPSRICRDVRAICARACTFTRRGGPVSPCVSARARARPRDKEEEEEVGWLRSLSSSPLFVNALCKSFSTFSSSYSYSYYSSSFPISRNFLRFPFFCKGRGWKFIDWWTFRGYW